MVRASVACAIGPFDGAWLEEASVVGESSLWLALLQSTDWTGREAGPWFLSGASLLVLSETMEHLQREPVARQGKAVGV